MIRSNCTNTNLPTTHTAPPDHRSTRHLDRCREATTVGRDWLRAYTTRKSAPKGTGVFLAASLAVDADVLARIEGNDLAADLLAAGETTTYGRSPALTRMLEWQSPQTVETSVRRILVS
jgi:hypothetical protein